LQVLNAFKKLTFHQQSAASQKVPPRACWTSPLLRHWVCASFESSHNHESVHYSSAHSTKACRKS